MKNLLSNGFLIPGAIVIAGGLIAWSLFLGGGGSDTASSHSGGGFGNSNSGSAENIASIGERDHIRGDVSAPVTIVEFSDFECPFCKRLHPTLEQVVGDFDGQVKWVYRHFPLTQIHGRALSASIASECAAEIGGNEAFWHFADSLFDNQNALGPDLYQELAGELGLDSGAFNSCMDSRDHSDLVQSHYQDAINAGGRGTPFVVVLNDAGETFPFSGALPYEQIRGIVEQALASN